MNIVFTSNQLSERGTETALIDYAYANEEFSDNKSILAFPEHRIFDKNRYESLAKRFKILLYKDSDDFNNQLKMENADLVYAIVSGSHPDITDEITVCKTFVHSVFSLSRRHGTYYVPIHEYLNKAFRKRYPVLPHIVRKFPDFQKMENLREKLGIPENAKVFGYYGGSTNFNIPFAKEACIEIAKKESDIYFLFMNISDFTNHEKLSNIIFLPGSTDLEKKSEFIQACTAMIHARVDGETFGLSVAEFSIMNKPVITYKPNHFIRFKNYLNRFRNKQPVYAEAHLMNLGNHAITYSNKTELIEKITKFDDFYYESENYDCFSEQFSPEKVINTFYSIIDR